jgi:hypothetical protein
MNETMWKATYDLSVRTAGEELESIIESIRNGSCTLTDDEITIKIGQFTPSYNCEGAAIGFFKIMSLICPYRQSLIDNLLMISIRPVYYLGIDTVEGIVQFMTEISIKTQQNWLRELSNNTIQIQTAFENLLKNEEKF